MPTYDYLCRTCGHRFEHFQSMSSEPLTKCPVEDCILEDERKGTGDVVRAIGGGAGLVFKGGGFYLTDYARKGSKGGGGEGGSSSGGGTSSGGGSSSES
ncbi:MAG TPA: zinc ribbon domain-containing protein [Candidatus Kapabacteria bacterium]|jgi:putative FmdB family regulatory protein|nr:zinc ribbon domain-containing protein [Candidatus Kapabacteria bacterium]